MKKMKNLYLKFREWLKYVRNYKENKENDSIYDHKIIEKNKEIAAIKEELKKSDFLNEERANLIKLQEKRIQNLNQKYTEIKKEIKGLNEILKVKKELINDLNNKLIEKEKSRKASAGALGGYKTKISQLQKELEKANYTINFYKTHQKSPTLEELKAYEYSRKEVERRQKNENK